jgi:uncharacterized protein involved in response to NO
MGTAGTFSAASSFHIQAHGQAQVFGWMIMVIMGFAYQAFPRFWHTCLASPQRANLSFWLITLGVVLSVVGTFAAPALKLAAPLAVIGGALELCASVLFAWEIAATLKQSGKSLEPYMFYVFVSLGWLILGTAFNLVYTWALVSSVVHADYALLASTLQIPMRDIQFHGLALTIIMGVSLRTLPHIFGLPKVSNAFAVVSLCALTLAVVGQVALALTGQPSNGLPAMTLLVVALGFIWQFKIWRRFPDGDRSEKFIKAAWLWLLVSLAMLVGFPLYESVSGHTGSHAYAGAIRHAITVGFISLMIMGYTAKVVATLNGFNTGKLTALVLPFVLVNAGCAVRVVGQAFTDVLPQAFPITGLSGCLEATGMAIWGVHIGWLIIAGGNRRLHQDKKAAPPMVTADQIVADVLDWFPQTEHIFVEFGFSAVTNPVLRRTAARQVTIQTACRMHGVDAALFVAVLNEEVQTKRCEGCTGGGCGGADVQQDAANRCH